MHRLFRIVVMAFAMAALVVAVVSQSAFADRRDFVFANHSNHTVVSVWVQPVDGYWSDDLLGSQLLYPGQNVPIYFNPLYGDTCYFNVELLDTNGRVDDLYAVNLCATNVLTYR